MANKQRGFVHIELDKKRTLRFNLNALVEIEDKLGVPLAELSQVNMGGHSRGILYKRSMKRGK